MVIPVLVDIAWFAFLAWIWFGRRPTLERFEEAHNLSVGAASLPTVRTALRRAYLGRVLGALLGAVVLGCAALIAGIGPAVGSAFIGLIAGTMVGIAVAQHRPRPEPGTVREASLAARTIQDYAPRHARGLISATALTCLGVLVLVVSTAPAGLGPYTPVIVVAAATLLIVPVGFWLQRRIVEAPRDTIEPLLDDVLRTTAVRALHHSMLGVLLCGLAIASLSWFLTQNTMTVETPRETVFTAAPGSTSISVDTGLRQAGNPEAPVRVFWIDADGAEHQTGWFTVAGAPMTGNRDLPPIALPIWITFLVASGWALIQWFRAGNASRRDPTNVGRAGVVPGTAAPLS